MLLLATELSTPLEVLDEQENVLSTIAASLCHLDSRGAILAVPSDSPTPCLHWGSRVRFYMEDGSQRFEIMGAVIAHDRDQEQQVERELDPNKPLQKEIWVRVWECRNGLQRRNTPRRATRFAVRYRPLLSGNAMPLSDENQEWFQGWC